MCVKKDFNQCQQRWWKLFELTTANLLFFKVLSKLLHCSVLLNIYVDGVLQKWLSNKNAPAIFKKQNAGFITPEIFADRTHIRYLYGNTCLQNTIAPACIIVQISVMNLMNRHFQVNKSTVLCLKNHRHIFICQRFV